MIVDAVDFLECEVVSTDVCIIGAGALGLLMAEKFARSSSTQVLVLEQGAAEPLPEPAPELVKNHGDLPSFVEGSYNQGLGGSTWSWGGQLMQFDDVDFTKRAEVENSGWPISKNDLLPYYAETEALLKTQYKPELQTLFGRLLKQPSIDSGIELSFSKWCPQKNFSKLFKETIANSSQISFLLDCKVTKISNKADSSEPYTLCVDLNKRQSVSIVAKTVVLASGGLGNYEILARSHHIQPSLPALGRYYHDHIGFYGAKLIPLNRAKFRSLFATKYRAGGKCVPKIKFNSKAIAEKQSHNINATIEAQQRYASLIDLPRLVFKRLKGDHTFRISSPFTLVSFLSGVSDIFVASYQLLVNRQISWSKNSEFFLIANCESAPLWSSHLALIEESEVDAKTCSADWRIDQQVHRSIQDFYLSVKTYLEENDIAKVVIKPTLQTSNGDWVDSAYSLYHHMGATRMGTSVDSSVVNEHCQVHGYPGLYVAGCSVLPTGSSSNPTLTAMALGLRLVDHIETRQNSE